MDRLISEQELLKHFDPREDWVVVQTIKAIPSAEPTKDLLIQIIRDILAMYVVDENGNQLSRDEVKCGAINIVKKYLKQLPSAEPKWIPVGKESPVAFEKVLVTYRLHYDDSIHVGIGNTTSNVNGRYYWCLDEQDYKTWDILAWMPLPKPYEPQEISYVVEQDLNEYMGNIEIIEKKY